MSIRVESSRGTFYDFPKGKSVEWKELGGQALCTVRSEKDGQDEAQGSFINPVSVIGSE